MLNEDGLYEDYYLYPKDLSSLKSYQRALNDSKGLAINLPGRSGVTALMSVVQNITPDLFELLDWLIQEQKANINLGDNQRRTPLMIACSRLDSSYELVTKLIKLGADFNLHTHSSAGDTADGGFHSNQSALGFAIRYANTTAIQALADAGVDVKDTVAKIFDERTKKTIKMDAKKYVEYLINKLENQEFDYFGQDEQYRPNLETMASILKTITLQEEKKDKLDTLNTLRP